MEYVKRELQRGLGDWEQRLNTALVPTAASDLRAPGRPAAGRNRQRAEVLDCRFFRWRARDVMAPVGWRWNAMARDASSAASAGPSASPRS